MRRLSAVAAMLVTALVGISRADNNTSRPIFSPAFRQTTTADGLPTSRVFAVIQDRQGYIWTGTENGLARYDGYTTKIFRHSSTNPSSISGDTIRGMYIDSNGHLWIGSYDGSLDLYHPKTDTFSHFRPSSNSAESEIWTINGSGDELWLGTFGNGLYLFNENTKQFTHFKHQIDNPNSLAGDRVNNVYIAKNGIVWLATSNGLDSYNPQSHRFTLHKLGIHTTDVYVWDIRPDPETGQLWIATQSGLYVQQTDSAFKLVLPDSRALHSHEIRSLLFVSKEYLWIGTFGDGVWLLNTKNYKLFHFQHNPSVASSLINNDVWQIYGDRDGTIWIATDLGLSRLVQNGMQISLIAGISENGVTTPIGQITGLHAAGNVLYVATSHGCVVISVTRSGLLEKRISSVWTQSFAENRHEHGDTWVGMAMGLLLNTSKRGTVLKRYQVSHNGRKLADIDAIADDGKYLWLGTFSQGLIRFNPETGDTLPYTLPNNNNLWNRINELRLLGKYLLIGTSSGVALLDTSTGKARIIADPSGLEGPFSVLSIDRSSNNNFLLGTSAGLIRAVFNPLKATISLTLVPQLSGKNSDPIMGIEEDSSGTIWLSTDYGLMTYNPKTGDVRHFSKNHGLPFNLFTIRAHATTSGDRLWFGGPYGLITFLPSTLKYVSAPAKVVINSITYYLSGNANRRTIPQSTHIILPHNADIIQFDFSALNYVFSPSSHYRYRLSGLDSQWIELGTRHQLTLSNLPPGNYRLALEASTTPGVWNGTATNVRLEILPPWWRTNWAYFLYALLILGAMFAYVHNQQRKLRSEREITARLRDADIIKSRFVEELETQVGKATSELRNTLEAVNIKNQELEIANRRASEGEQLKSQFLASMSHELRTPLTAIQGYLKLLSRTPISTVQSDYLRTIQNSSESLLAIINDSLDLSRIESGKLLIDEIDFDLRDLVEGTVQLLGPSAYAKNVELIRILPPDLPLGVRGDPLRIRQILTNLIGNAIKFTHSGSICIRVQEISRHEKEVTLGIAVSDTGIGIPKDAIKRLFEAYTRHESRTHAGVEGTGLGLSICKKLLDLMGGEIDVMSTPGLGSTFEFRVAFKLGKQPLPIKEIGTQYRIGLLDKHPLSRQAWQASLSRLQFQVIHLPTLDNLGDRKLSALVMVLGPEELDNPGSIRRTLGKIYLPHLIIATTNDREILANLGSLFDCPALSSLTTESGLNEELRRILPSSPDSPSSDRGNGAAPSARSDGDSSQQVILVADDNAINRKLLVTLLQQHGFRVAEAASGKELLELAQKQRWDLAFVDIHMPEMDGIETAQRLFATLEEPFPPIIAISADALPETRDNAIAAGIQDFLIKPYTESQLLELLHRYLASRH